LTIEYSPFQDFNSDSKVDLIISNPPFFSKNQLGESAKKNLAVHNDSLSIDQLATGVSNHLCKGGELFLLYPPFEMSLFIDAAKRLNLFPNQIFEFKDKASKKVIRQAAVFSSTKNETQTTELVIKQNDGNYTDAFIDLLKPYYLHL
jgi:tRNA1Val (adenine37-N6)-methyltransferase